MTLDQNATVATYDVTIRTVTTNSPTYERVYTVSPRYDESSIQLIATSVDSQTYGYIDWGDGTERSVITRHTLQNAKTDGMAEFTHEYATPGYYLVTVTGSVRYCSFGKIVEGIPDAEELSRVIGIANCSLNTYEGTMAVPTSTVDPNDSSIHTYEVYDNPIGTFADMPNADVLSTFKFGRRITNMTAMFRNSGITNKYKNIVIPASVRNLNYAFYNCSKLVTLDGMFDKLFTSEVLSTLANRSILCRNAFWFPVENTHITSSVPVAILTQYAAKFSTRWCDVYGTRFENAADEGRLLDSLASAMFANLPYVPEYQYHEGDSHYLPMDLVNMPSFDSGQDFFMPAYYMVSRVAGIYSCIYVNRSGSPTYQTTTISLDGTDKALSLTGLKLDMESYPALLSVLRSKTISYTKSESTSVLQLEDWLNSNPTGGTVTLPLSSKPGIFKEVIIVGKP